MAMQTISQETYNSRMENAIRLQPVRKTVPLGSIEVVNQGLLRVEGVNVPMEHKAFVQLAKILGVPLQFQGRVDKLFGEDANRALVNKMKSALIQQGMSTITVVASPTSKMVTGFLKFASEYISNSSFFEVANQVIDQHGLLVRDLSVNPSSGGVTINCFNPNAEFSIGDLKDEYFQGGITLSNSIQKGMITSPYLNRLVCTNGMIGESFQENYKLNNLRTSSLDDLRHHLNTLKKRNYQPLTFEERVRKAITTKASFAEIEAAAELILGNSGAKANEISKWVPYQETIDEYTKFGLPPIRMSDDQKKNAKTGTSIWDVVNGLTHFSTHESVFKVSEPDRRTIQKEAGAILASKFDMENQIISPFN